MGGRQPGGTGDWALEAAMAAMQGQRGGNRLT